jgi:hypothetical protein
MLKASNTKISLLGISMVVLPNSEPAMTPDKFAELICLDLDLSPSNYAPMVASLIKSQIQDYKRYYMSHDYPIPEDSRVIIKLDITTGKIHLRDRFEWDLDSEISPEQFARILVSDLGLGGEFKTLIAHSIHEQLHRIKRDGDFETMFAIEKPLRGQEESITWCPTIESGQEQEATSQMDLDRQTRLTHIIKGTTSRTAAKLYTQDPG